MTKLIIQFPLIGARCSEAQVDLTFVVDTSNTIGQQQNWNVIRQFMVDIVDNLPISQSNARVGLVTLADSATNRFYLNTYTTRDQVRMLYAFEIDLVVYNCGPRSHFKVHFSEVG